MAKVLLVEDDNNLREIYEARLQAEGYTIVSANDGEAALVIAKSEKPDLIISDVMMPKISGFEMLDILRNTDGLKEVKVIMLTALGQADDQARANKLGADRYLVKSQVTLEDIVKVSHELLQDGGAEPVPADAPTAAAPEPTPLTATEPTPAAPQDLAPTIAVATPPVAEPVVAPSDSSVPSAPDVPVAPAPDVPVAVPITEPVPDTPPVPPVTDTSTTPAASNNTQTSADEVATVEQQIENFVNNQPATPPAEVVPTTDPTTESNEAANDSSLSEAVNNLVADTEATEAALAVPGIAPSDIVEPPSEPAPESSTEKPAETENGDAVVVANKKVIKPLDSAPGKSLDELLAKEEAHEQSTTPPEPLVGDVNVTPEEDQPSGAPAPPPSQAGSIINPEGKPIDPNSIAL